MRKLIFLGVCLAFVIPCQASISYCANSVDGDINGDCVVDFKDFAVMASHWLEDNR